MLVLQRVYRGHEERRRVAALRAAMKVTDKSKRDAMLQEINQLDQMRKAALAEMKQAWLLPACLPLIIPLPYDLRPAPRFSVPPFLFSSVTLPRRRQSCVISSAATKSTRQ